MLFTHVVLGTNDLARAKAFYDALFEVIGGKVLGELKGKLLYEKAGQMFMIGRPIDGHSATVANGFTLGFSLPSAEAVETWHKVGIEHGGEAIEDAPGVRTVGSGKYFLAYLRDPDGNKLCARYDM